MRHTEPPSHFDDGQLVREAIFRQFHKAECAPGARARQAQFCVSRRGRFSLSGYGAPMAEKNAIGPYQMYLRAWRDFRGLTLETVGERLEVEHTTVGRWERGELPISSKWLTALSHLYDVHPRDLLGPPIEAELAAKIAEIGDLIPEMNEEAFSHLRFFARNVTRR